MILRRLAYSLVALVAIVAVIAVVHRVERRNVRAQPVIVTVIPGSTVNTIAKSLSRVGLPSKDFLRLTLPIFEASSTGSATSSASISSTSTATATTTGLGLEGYLYPDTYDFIAGESADRIVKTMTDNFDAHFPQDLFDNQYGVVRSKRDIVIMASILEKEAALDTDRKIIAGILWKRLDHQLPLQVDSTVHYFVTPPPGMSYNTYQNTGLPFGPISDPSLESIVAALEPTATDYWYFLSSRDGKLFYSRTLSEHLINKAKYVE